MRPGRHDEIVTAILAEIDTVDRTLARLRVPASAVPDIRQETVIATWNAARWGRILWRDPGMLRAYLRAVATWQAFRWFRDNPLHGELHESLVATTIDAEGMVIARGVLRFLRENTEPERWRAVRAYAKGIPVHAIAAREHVPVATIYDRIRRARFDFTAALRRDDAAIFIRRRK
jgi:DNA-directed RNA polymerase specialized sigma24 family protein